MPLSIILCGLGNNILTPWKVIGNSERKGVSKDKQFKGNFEAKLKFSVGFVGRRGKHTKKLKHWRVWIFFGRTHLIQIWSIDVPVIKKAKCYTDWHVENTQRNWITILWGVLVMKKNVYNVNDPINK